MFLLAPPLAWTRPSTIPSHDVAVGLELLLDHLPAGWDQGGGSRRVFCTPAREREQPSLVGLDTSRLCCIVSPSRHIVLPSPWCFTRQPPPIAASHLTRTGSLADLPSEYNTQLLIAWRAAPTHAMSRTGGGAWLSSHPADIRTDPAAFVLTFVSSSTQHSSLQDSGPSSSLQSFIQR